MTFWRNSDNFTTIEGKYARPISQLLYSFDWWLLKQSYVVSFVMFCRTPITRIPRIGGKEVDLYLLYRRVIGFGGWRKVNSTHCLNLPPFRVVYISIAATRVSCCGSCMIIFSIESCLLGVSFDRVVISLFIKDGFHIGWEGEGLVVVFIRSVKIINILLWCWFIVYIISFINSLYFGCGMHKLQIICRSFMCILIVDLIS